MILEEKDASDWIYRGEGGANLVLAYAASSPLFVGKVIRIQKAPKNDKAKKPVNGAASALTTDEQLLWRDHKELVSSPNKEVVEQRYVKDVIIPLLGPKHIDPGVRVSVSKEFLESVDKKVTKQRPPWRVNAANVDTSHDSALILNDHSLFSQGVSNGGNGGDCLSVEIKPKCGFLPTSRFISEENKLKRCVSRFKMHQILKLEQNEISEVSEYDPLDLFSGSKDRVSEAVKALYSIPQNNFRVFLNGSLVLGGSGESTGRTSPETAHAFEDALKGFIQSNDGLRTKCFLQLVCDTVYDSGVLDKLLEVQKLDKLDIEGAIHCYYNIIKQPCPICKEAGNLEEEEESLHCLPLDESLKIVKDYLIAATAKDCSLMISFRLRNAWDSAPSCDAVCLKSTNQTFDYKVHFIDLSMKPLKRMEAYYKLDNKIISFYTRKQKGEGHVGDPKRSDT